MSSTNKGNQTIGCNVSSCVHFDGSENMCKLHSINVEPMEGCHNGKACDESMCGSYKCQHEI
ncbi:MAG: DUF1540 domain-containing protein [Eubacteriales bacterium]|nr:DUF1540 domain-containing protein [Eubacteriales bacterium]